MYKRQLLALGTPGKTAVCMLADKEEIGSAGVSGMKSAAFDTFVSDLCDAQRVPLKACYEKSFCLSTDVTEMCIRDRAKLEQLQEAVDKLHLWAFMGNDKLHKRAFSIEKRMERIRTTDKPTKERRLDIKRCV